VIKVKKTKAHPIREEEKRKPGDVNPISGGPAEELSQKALDRLRTIDEAIEKALSGDAERFVSEFVQQGGQ